MAPTVGLSPRRIRWRISRYVPADGTQVAGPQARKMWNYFFPGPLLGAREHEAFFLTFDWGLITLIATRQPRSGDWQATIVVKIYWP